MCISDTPTTSGISPTPAPGYAGDLTLDDAWQLVTTDADAVLVDVRTEGEWAHIGVPDLGAAGKRVIFAPWVTGSGQPNPTFLDDVRAGIAASGTAATSIAFICRSGQRSVGAAKAATAAGLGPAYNVLEGFEGAVGPSGARDVEGWKVAGLPWGLPDADGQASSGTTSTQQ